MGSLLHWTPHKLLWSYTEKLTEVRKVLRGGSMVAAQNQCWVTGCMGPHGWIPTIRAHKSRQQPQSVLQLEEPGARLERPKRQRHLPFCQKEAKRPHPSLELPSKEAAQVCRATAALRAPTLSWGHTPSILGGTPHLSLEAYPIYTWVCTPSPGHLSR